MSFRADAAFQACQLDDVKCRVSRNAHHAWIHQLEERVLELAMLAETEPWPPLS